MNNRTFHARAFRGSWSLACFYHKMGLNAVMRFWSRGTCAVVMMPRMGKRMTRRKGGDGDGEELPQPGGGHQVEHVQVPGVLVLAAGH